jgi:outer membrane translocation and assembly module TamA
VGVGTRIQTPFALIRIDYGVPLNRKPTELGSRWIFSVGQSF